MNRNWKKSAHFCASKALEAMGQMQWTVIQFWYVVWPGRAQLGQMGKTRQMYFQNIREIDESFSCLQQFDKFSVQNVHMQWPETDELCLSEETCFVKTCEIFAFKWTYFRRVLATWIHCDAQGQISTGYENLRKKGAPELK